MKTFNLTLPRFCSHRHTSDWLWCQGWEDNKSRIHRKMPSRMSRCKIPCLWHRHLRFFFQCVQCCNSQVSGLNWARHPKRIITHGFWGPSKFPVPCRSVCRLLFLFEKQFPLILCKGTVAALRKWKCSWIFGDISCSTGGNSLPSFLSQSLPVNCCGPETAILQYDLMAHLHSFQ